MSSDSSKDAGRDSGASREAVRRLLLDAGFDRIGFAAAGPSPAAGRLRRWLARGFAGGMTYLEKSFERRADPRRVVEGARTVIAAALHYKRPEVGSRSTPGGAGPLTGKIAAYALGEDYHRVLERRLHGACVSLKQAFPATYRYYVDTGPVLERDWAERAGVGWIGKNTCAIHPLDGSYFFLGSIITTLEVEPDPPAADHCGTCRLCIDACPTGAIVAPYELDSRLCISYLTIENRGEIPAALEPQVGNLVFGCDICQEVCPFNREDRGGQVAGDPELVPRTENLSPPLRALASLDEAEFRQRFPRSAVRRAKFAGFLRNIIVALGNSPGVESESILRGLENRDDVKNDPVLRQSLDRAMERQTRAALGPPER